MLSSSSACLSSHWCDFLKKKLNNNGFLDKIYYKEIAPYEISSDTMKTLTSLELETEELLMQATTIAVVEYMEQ